MKFPSLSKLASEAGLVIKRFPFEIAFALTGTVAAIINIELDRINVVGSNWCYRVLMACNLGLLLCFSAGLFSDSKGFSAIKKNLLKALATVAAIGFLFFLDPLERTTDYLRFFLLSLGFHLLVSFAGFTQKGHVNGFWQFNRGFFLRFITGVLYCGVLFAGLAIAISSMNFLFGFKFEWDTYSILFVLIAGLFQTFYFLAGVPSDLRALQQDNSYPKGLKIFTQYVLIPLASVYVAILLAYEIKIILEWNLPKGLVSNLILGYAVFGILSILLIYPIRDHEENGWIKIYSKNFYFFLIPLIGLLLVAVGARVFKYGITEERYFLIILACWLTFLLIYFLASHKQNIRIIPVSLCVVTLISVYGPQGAFFVSEKSQQHRLAKFLTDNTIRDRNTEIVNVSSYLINMHGVESVQQFVKRDVKAIERYFISQVDVKKTQFGTYSKYEAKSDLQDSLQKLLVPGMKNLSTNEYGIDGDMVSYFNSETRDFVRTPLPGYVLDLTSNDHSSSFKIGSQILRIDKPNDSTVVFKIGGEIIRYNPDIKLIYCLKNRNKFKQDSSGMNNYIVPHEQLSDTLFLNNRQIVISFRQLNGGYRRGNSDDIYLLYYSCFVFVEDK